MRSSLLRRSVLAAALAAVVSAAPQAADRKLEIEWVDTLGGAATLIVTPAGESILVDTGWAGYDSRDAKRIKAALDKHGLTAIDHLVITHYHADHYGGVPQLAALVPIRHFYDHGPMSALPEDRNFAEMYGAYRAAAKDTTTTLKPGDTIALKQGTGPKLTLTVVAANGDVVGGATTANPACASAVAQPDDTTDNRRSVAFVLRYGAFDFYDGGDLTGDVEAKLACPADRVGAVDLYQVTHHGQANSNNPVLLATLKPTVAVMNNGPRKGGAAETFQRLKALPSLKGLFAIHKNASTGPEVNAAPESIANLESPDAGHGFRATVDEAAKSFTITNFRTNETRSFAVQ
ncbi:MAG: ComEC/Rec2 family competence protein [Vicinamibacteria bacterium]